MRIVAEVAPKKKKDLVAVLQAFFGEGVNQQAEDNYISIKDGCVNLSAVFDEIPLSLIEAIGKCGLEDVKSFKLIKGEAYRQQNLGSEVPVLEELSQEEAVQEEAREEQISEEEIQKEEAHESQEQVEEGQKEEAYELQSQEEKVQAERLQRSVPKRKKTLTITSMKELDEIVQRTNSFDEFVAEVVKWADLKKHSEFFINVFKCATELENVTWKSVEEALSEKGIPYTSYNKIYGSKMVNVKLSSCGYEFTVTEFIKIVVGYKERFSSNEENALEEEVRDEDAQENLVQEAEIQEAHSEDASNQGAELQGAEKQVKTVNKFLPCLPFNESFEEKMAEMELEWSAQEKASYILEFMGIDSVRPNQREQILEIVNAAISVDEPTFLQMFDELQPNYLTYRAWLSKFIDDYVKKYSTEQVKVFDFLNDLRKLVL